MTDMVDKLATLKPEMALGIGACVCLALGLAPQMVLRRATGWAAGIALIVAAALVFRGGDPMGFTAYVKLATASVGLLLLLVAMRTPDTIAATRNAEADAARGRRFEPGDVMRGEFFAFFLFSLTGVMLCAGATDLVWLFLALELTSLPTYVMVATSRDRSAAQEAAVKYFFLGALAAAVFLYGFALIYGATGTTVLFDAANPAQSIAGFIAAHTADGAALPPLLLTGVVLAIVGIAFKIAAVPMHFYAADVYEGAATPVTAFLAFVPKTAGFVSIILLLNLLPRPLPEAVAGLLVVMAALTMTIGNVLGLLQTNVKRVLAYSSIAHSGYMLVALAAGPQGGVVIGMSAGVAAVLFYLVIYALATLAGFAILACLEARGEEAQTYDDIAGLARRHPILAALMLISMLSLIGLPPFAGFVGKIYLFTAAYQQGLLLLVIIAVLNSAVSAVYYLRIVAACYFAEPTTPTQYVGGRARPLAAAIAAISALVLGLAGGWLVDAADRASSRGAGNDANVMANESVTDPIARHGGEERSLSNTRRE